MTLEACSCTPLFFALIPAPFSLCHFSLGRKSIDSPCDRSSPFGMEHTEHTEHTYAPFFFSLSLFFRDIGMQGTRTCMLGISVSTWVTPRCLREGPGLSWLIPFLDTKPSRVLLPSVSEKGSSLNPSKVCPRSGRRKKKKLPQIDGQGTQAFMHGIRGKKTRCLDASQRCSSLSA